MTHIDLTRQEARRYGFLYGRRALIPKADYGGFTDEDLALQDYASKNGCGDGKIPEAIADAFKTGYRLGLDDPENPEDYEGEGQ